LVVELALYLFKVLISAGISVYKFNFLTLQRDNDDENE